MNLVPEQTKITGSIITPLGFNDTKRPLYLSPDLGKSLVPGLIGFRKRSSSSPSFHQSILYALCSKFLYSLFIVIGLVSIHTLFISTDEFIKYLVIIDPDIGYSCFPNYAGALIHSYMDLVSIAIFLVFTLSLGTPRSIRILDFFPFCRWSNRGLVERGVNPMVLSSWLGTGVTAGI
jgi:hypothetical protein